MVHFVCIMLANRVTGVVDLPRCLALDSAVARFRYRRPWSPGPHQCSFLTAGAVASWTKGHLIATLLLVAYFKINNPFSS